MKRAHLLLAAALLQSLFLLQAQAQETEPRRLPDARAGAPYRQSIPRVLLDRYGLSVANGSRKATTQWTRVGSLPPGLRLDASGVLTGTPQTYRETPYTFRVRVADAQEPDAEPLVLPISLKVLPPKLRLVGVDGGGAAAPADEGAEAEAPSDEDEAAGDTQAQAAPPQKPQAVCGKNGITIETATLVRSEVIPVNIKLDGGRKAEVKTLDITVRGTGATRETLDPVTVGGASSVPLDIRFKKEGDNVISVNGLDKDNKLVACAETTVRYTPAHVDAAKATLSVADDFTLVEQSTYPLTVVLGGDTRNLDRLKYSVRDERNGEVDQGESFVKPGDTHQQVLLRLRPRKNSITVWGIDANGNRVTDNKGIVITCAGRCAGEPPRDAAGTPPALSIDPPVFRVVDQPDTKVRVTITNNDGKTDPSKRVDRLYYRVTDATGFDLGADTVEVHRARADEDTTPVDLIVPLARSGGGEESVNTVSVFGLNANSREPIKITEVAMAEVRCNSCDGPSSNLTGDSLYTRAIVGFEQVGGSATASTQKPFLDLFFSAPIGKNVNILTPGFQFWGNARIASVTTQSNPSSLGAFAGAGFLTNFQNVDVNKIGQGFDFLVGVDVKLIPQNKTGYFSLLPGTRQRSSLSFIASFGGITPLNTDDTSQTPTVFKIPTLASGAIDPNFLSVFPEAAGKKNIAFVAPTRDRFFRQYYGGIRVKTLFYDKRDQPINRFPAIFDFTVGQNELVTGSLRNVVRFEGFYPFPFKSASFFYLYGTAMMKLGRKGGRVELPLFLEQASGASPTSPDTVLVSIDRNPTLRSTRDNYRLGIGVNLIELLNKLREQPPAR